MNLLVAILLFGASQGLLLCAVILVIKTGERGANLLLGLFIGISSIELGLFALLLTEPDYRSVIFKLYAVAILKGPALYLYVRALTEPGFSPGPGQLKHLLLIFPNLVLIWLLTSSASEGQSSSDYAQLLGTGPVFWYSMMLNLVGLAYAWAALGVLNRYRQRVEDLFSSTEEISLGWLKWLLGFYITLRLGNIGLDIMTIMGVPQAGYKSFGIALLNIGVIYFVSFGGLRQPIIFSGHFRRQALEPDAEAAAAAKPAEGAKYDKSGLSDSDIERIWARLTLAMEQERLYMDPELTLPGLAAAIEVSPNALSRVINSRAGRNFYDFINAHRVEAASAMLLEPANDGRKMLDMAMEVGFKSQSTFYNHFKKHCGMTPTQYRAAAH